MSPPPGSRALHAAVGPDAVLAGRYRLRAELPPVAGDPPEAQRWLATDDVLARPVGVLLLLASGRRAPWGRELLEAAAAAGTVTSPVLVQVYDAALEEVPAERFGRPAGTVDVAYVVHEHVSGQTLADALADGPLEPDEAVELALAATEGLRDAHAGGVVHGSVSPATLVLPADGGIRLRDTAVGAALAGRAPDSDGRPGRTQTDDVRALAACLYAMLTARWPAGATSSPGCGLPPAPTTGGRDGRLCSPRQVRAGVPRNLDQAVKRALDPVGSPGAGPVRTAADLHRLLRSAADADAAARAPAPRPRRVPRVPPAVTRRLPAALVVALLAAVATVAYSTGRDLGTVQRETDELEALVDSTPAPVPGDTGAGSRLDLTAAGVRVTAFDPPPGDGGENNAATANVVDGDPGTGWDTERYDTSRFGGIKSGVGLLVDLGAPATVQQVELGVTPGVDLELRAADQPFPDAAAYPVVATVTEAGAIARLVPQQPVTARYFLVWLTRVPAQEGRFRGGVRELFFVRP